MRLIDADALTELLKKHRRTIVGGELIEWHRQDEVDCCIAYIKKRPTVDAVEVVRCKHCCYWDRETVRQNSNDVSWWNEAVCRQHSVDGNEPHEMWTDADWFCADGTGRSE